MGKKKNSGDDFGFKNLDKFKFRNPPPRREKLIPEPPAPYGQAGYKKPHTEALWSPSYFAVSVGGAPLDILKEYIRNQEKPS